MARLQKKNKITPPPRRQNKTGSVVRKAGGARPTTSRTHRLRGGGALGGLGWDRGTAVGPFARPPRGGRVTRAAVRGRSGEKGGNGKRGPSPEPRNNPPDPLTSKVTDPNAGRISEGLFLHRRHFRPFWVSGPRHDSPPFWGESLLVEMRVKNI